MGSKNASYVKLQNAYISETGTKVGNWYLIGYNGPGEWVPGSEAKTKAAEAGASTKSTNFTYVDKLAPDNVIPQDETEALEISNNAKLNDCAAGANWKVSLKAASTGNDAGEATYKAEIGGNGCDALTPNFANIK